MRLYQRFVSSERVVRAHLETRKAQYLYRDESGYVFMNTETYEQFPLTDEELGDAVNYLKDGIDIEVQYIRDKPIGIELPIFVELAVVQTEPATRGDTVTNVTKNAVLESGYEVKVPLFIGEGDILKIDTRNGEYVTRISKA